MSSKASDSTSSTPPASDPDSRGARVKAYLLGAPRLHLATIAVLAILVVVLAIWGAIDRRSAASALGRERTKARAALVEQTNELLLLSAQPLAWALRTEMLASDASDLDAYMAKLAVLPNVRLVVVFAADGKVVATSNMKFNGKVLAEVFPDITLAGTDTRLATTATDLRIIVPIMGYDRQIGMVVVDYAQASIDSKLGR